MAANLATELNVLLTAYAGCWTARTPTKLRGLWHAAEANPYYVAEEIPKPLMSWAEIEPYWRDAEKILKRFSVRTWDLHCKLIAADLAAMQFMMHWNAVLAGLDPSPIGLDVKVFALAQQTPEGWRFRHSYIESPLGALPYIKSIYRGNVDQDFLTP
jgi:hypothetical protein